jgi:hypothetical protein
MSGDWRRALPAGGRGPRRRATIVVTLSALVILATLLVPPAPAGPPGLAEPTNGTAGGAGTDGPVGGSVDGGADGGVGVGVGGGSGGGADGDAGADASPGSGSGSRVVDGPPSTANRDAAGRAVARRIRRAHAAGVTGEGVTVGVVDVTGFDTAHPALSDRVRGARAFAPGDDVANGGRNDHGTAAAVTVARVAPDASLYLATFDRPAGFQRAVEWLVARGADVVVAPVAAYGAADDGSSLTARVAANATAAGATVVVPTGNLARGHWEGPYRPAPDGAHRFGDDEGTTRTWLQPPDAGGFRTTGHLTAWLSVDVLGGDARGPAPDDGPADGSPSAGPGSGPSGPGGLAPDLELALYRANATGARVVATSEPATGPGVDGERLAADLQPGQHYLVVRPDGVDNGSGRSGVDTPAGLGGVDGVDAEDVRIEVASPSHDLSRRRSAGSLVAPATGDAGGLVAVGAATSNGTPAAYSSRGPTADGRLGVDVVATTTLWPAPGSDDGSGAAGAGTSAAAATVGGTVALVRAANPSLSPARVELLVRATAADVPPPGPDVAAGYGGIDPWRAVRRARRLPGGAAASAGAGPPREGGDRSNDDRGVGGAVAVATGNASTVDAVDEPGES